MDGINCISLSGSTPTLSTATPPSAMALGLFDGVHIGHRALLSTAVKEARRSGIVPSVFTFSENSEIKRGAARLYDDRAKLRLLRDAGIELVYIADFAAVSSLSPEDFVTRVLCKRLNCRIAVSGFNFRFGAGASGNADDLTRLCAASGIGAIIVDEEQVDGVTVSTTLIRRLLSEGKVSRAATLLGRPYFLSGTVLHGRGQGAGWGFPTVNTPLREDIPLLYGVYSSAVCLGDKLYPALTNVGVCPSFGAREPHAETLILGFEGNLYGKEVDVHLIEYIRDERIFSSAEELREQIEKDKNLAKERTKDIKWQEIGLK
jgi:riboflavin kinase/FMN adenylyltransferase